MTTAAIIGGGIAGPVAAMALQRAGIDASVYEARSEPANTRGLFLNLASNGLDALRAVNIDVGSLDGFHIPRLVMWNGAGCRLGEVTNGVTDRPETISVCVKRGALHDRLRTEAVRRGIRYHFGRRLESLDAGENQVTARFADGTSASADLLIGADGIRSRVRSHLDAAATEPAYTGYLSVGGYSRAPGLAPTPRTQHMVFGRRPFFGYLVRGDGECWWFANVATADQTSAQLAEIPAGTWIESLQNLFADDMGLINEIIRNSDQVGAHPIHDIATSSVWSKGRVALIGDALHAMSPSAGQGASIACEDAVVLAQCLRDLPDLTRAFAEFERIRRPRVERVVAYSRKRGSNKVAGRSAGYSGTR